MNIVFNIAIIIKINFIIAGYPHEKQYQQSEFEF